MVRLLLSPEINGEEVNKRLVYWRLFVDGASRNNPGLSGVGVYLLKNDVPIIRSGFFVGIKTNNQAEYLALLLGLFYLQQHVHTSDLIQINSDSQLLIRQLEGAYKVKNNQLIPLYHCARKLMESLNVSLFHRFREDNVQADFLANKGINDMRPLPDDFCKFLGEHKITI